MTSPEVECRDLTTKVLMNAGTETKGIDLFFIATGFSNESDDSSCRFIKQISSIDLEGKFKMTSV